MRSDERDGARDRCQRLTARPLAVRRLAGHQSRYLCCQAGRWRPLAASCCTKPPRPLIEGAAAFFISRQCAVLRDGRTVAPFALCASCARVKWPQSEISAGRRQ